jgi:hypothetical protein
MPAMQRYEAAISCALGVPPWMGTKGRLWVPVFLRFGGGS